MSKIEGISAFCSPLEKSREEENSSWIYSSSSSSSFSFLSFGVRRVLPVPIEKELASNRRANFATTRVTILSFDDSEIHDFETRG